MKPEELKIAMVHEDGDFGQGVTKGAKAAAEKAGMNVVADISYNAKGTNDLTSVILQLKNLQPDVINVVQYDTDAQLFWKQAKQLDLNVKALIGNGAGQSSDNFGKTFGKNADGIFDTSSAMLINKKALTPEAQKLEEEFFARYEQKFGKKPDIYVLISLGLTLVFGVMKVANFAHGDFLMLGMFGSFFLFEHFNMDPYLSLFIMTPLMFVIGLITYKFIVQRTMNRPHVVQIFAFIGLSVALQNAALVGFSADFWAINTPVASAVFKIDSLHISVPLLIAVLCAAVMTVLMFLFLHYTYTGKSIRSASQDPFAAALMGVSNHKINMLSFGIGLGLLGVAGSLLIPVYSVYPMVGQQFVLIAFVVVVLGGLGSLPGAHALPIGLKKKLELARAFATRPSLLFLDEVMGGLNPKEVNDMMELITVLNREHGITVCMIEHVMAAVVALCERIVVLQQGRKLMEGTPAEVTSNEAVIEAYLGGEFAHA
ncbi:ABC transporter permease subunit [Aneurinibacillus terranovensis]|uniref:ABC transporter permease subunit n=1 Tax=Aneurinibacillus terranovensis TaxID=278991 RepID=UPI0004119454